MDRNQENSPREGATARPNHEDGSHAASAGTAHTAGHAHTAASTHDVRDGSVRAGKAREFSGQGATVPNLILFFGGMITIVASFWLLASYPNSAWLYMLGILIYGVALFVPTTLLSSRTAKRSTGGTELTMHLPRDRSELAVRPGVTPGSQVNH